MDKTLVKSPDSGKPDPPEPQIVPWRPPPELLVPIPRVVARRADEKLNRWEFLTDELGYGTYLTGICFVIAILAWYFWLPLSVLALTGVLGGLAFPICLLGFLIYLARIRRQYWLVRYGLTAPGRIVREEYTLCDFGGLESAHYTFITAQGVKIDAVEDESWRIPGLSKGCTLTVLYDPKRPGRSMLYAGSMYRACPLDRSDQAS